MLYLVLKYDLWCTMHDESHTLNTKSLLLLYKHLPDALLHIKLFFLILTVPSIPTRLLSFYKIEFSKIKLECLCFSVNMFQTSYFLEITQIL
jgi:hypothetical protein